jgi:hypothetical protein
MASAIGLKLQTSSGFDNRMSRAMQSESRHA